MIAACVTHTNAAAAAAAHQRAANHPLPICRGARMHVLCRARPPFRGEPEDDDEEDRRRRGIEKADIIDVRSPRKGGER